MHILILGGSYFTGKHFAQLAKKEHKVTLFNRGNRPLDMEGVCQVKGDRRRREDLQALQGVHYDAVVDFCGYEKGDIERVFQALPHCFDRYIFISTCDVYPHGTGQVWKEDAPYEPLMYGGPEGDYIAGKIALEKELEELGSTTGIPYHIFRPGMIYGAGNYAPREGMYFHWIREAGQILHPVDATGSFQMVYVKDVARAIMGVLNNPGSCQRSYNLTPLPMITYESFACALEKGIGKEFARVEITVEGVKEKGIPLPFPLTGEESNAYEGSRALELIGEYTALEEGLKETWRETFGE